MRVLVVDDSAVARAALTMVLSGPGDFRVTTAPDPIVARRKMALDSPDVIVLDLAMPRMTGLEFLAQLEPGSPPVVVFAAGAGPGTPTARRALDAGASAVLEKPPLSLASPTALRGGELLVSTVRKVVGSNRPAPSPLAGAARIARPNEQLVAIGASMGGPDALRVVLAALPGDFPGIVIVQHMPEGFTGAFARSLGEACGLRVREARGGEAVGRGDVLVARGDHHLEVVGGPGRYRVHVSRGPRVAGHRPSADVLFSSVARAAGASSVGLVLTGMGADGARGLLTMKLAGARTGAQDEASSVVFGMAKEACRLGAVDEVVTLSECGAFLVRATRRPEA